MCTVEHVQGVWCEGADGYMNKRNKVTSNGSQWSIEGVSRWVSIILAVDGSG
jgi:hypothetical protein